MSDGVLILGAGQAGSQTAISLRQLGCKDPIAIVGDETHPPYQRPPLSKKYLKEDLDVARLYLRPVDLYRRLEIELTTGLRATAIDRSGRRVIFEDGRSRGYDHLVLALGATARPLSVPGGAEHRINHLRGIADFDRLKPVMAPGKRLTIVGAGYLGLELAAVAAERGATVVVLQRAPSVLSRVCGSVVAGFFDALHRRRGVDIRLRTMVAAISEAPAGHLEVRERSGAVHAADAVVAAIGGTPTVDLAAAAGLDCDDGIVVDLFCRTSDHHIFAAGDCTRHPSRVFGCNVRLESVPNAIEQGKTVAASIAGRPAAYDQVPWFWSDQYEFKLQSVGLPRSTDEQHLVGDLADGRFAVIYTRAGRVVGADAVNFPEALVEAKQAVSEGSGFGPHLFATVVGPDPSGRAAQLPASTPAAGE